MIPFPRRMVVGAGLGLAAALGLVPALANPAPVSAASPALTITSDATYDVRPDQHRVAVIANLTVTNHLKDTINRQFYFRTAFLTVQPGTSGFELTGGSGSPQVRVHQATDTYTSLKLDFGANLGAGRTTRLVLSFDILDSGGDPARPVRVSPSLVTFGAWAFATPSTPGSTVEVRLPSDFRVTIGRGPLHGPEADGSGVDRWSSGTLRVPLDFVADVVADREIGAPTETPILVALRNASASVVVRSWPDDPGWADRVRHLVEQALPILERDIGVSWPVEGPLQVNEVLVRGGSGYAGVFAPAEQRIDISYSASDAVVIHELAHAWFNGRLVADRWAAEAFASYYGELATRELGLEIRPPDPVEPGHGTIPLNAWGATDDPGAQLTAYAAALELAREIADRAGADNLRAVWDLAARGVGAYRPPRGEGELVAGPPDWRGLLDLLEDQTGQDFGDLWRTWVARPEDLAALEARSSARVAYNHAVAAAGAWQLPISVRDAMRSWRFDAALGDLAEADNILAERETLGAEAAAVGVTLPDSVRQALEGPDGVTAAGAELAAEQSALEMIAAAEAERSGGGGLVDNLARQLGLLFEDPGAQLDAAKLAFESGRISGARDAASVARDGWRHAGDSARWRIVSLILLGLAVATFALGTHRNRRRAAQPA
jgi:hypothetical protein